MLILDIEHIGHWGSLCKCSFMYVNLTNTFYSLCTLHVTSKTNVLHCFTQLVVQQIKCHLHFVLLTRIFGYFLGTHERCARAFACPNLWHFWASCSRHYWKKLAFTYDMVEHYVHNKRVQSIVAHTQLILWRVHALVDGWGKATWSLLAPITEDWRWWLVDSVPCITATVKFGINHNRAS